MTNRLTHSFYFILLFLFLGNIQSTIIAQCPPPGDIIFSEQADLVAFGANYPSCTMISGSVRIEGADITDLNDLSSLTSITGNFFIISNEILENLEGLENLSTIGDHLYISSNNQLNSLSGLTNLSSIGDYFHLSFHPALVDFSGLDNLLSIGGYLDIQTNNGLISLSGLNNLTSIGGHLLFNDNDALKNITGLSSLSSIGEYLSIDSNTPMLENIDGLSMLSSITGNISIINTQLTSANGLSSLSTVGGNLYFSSNLLLENMSGLENLLSIGGTLNIRSNNQLTSLNSLQNLNSVSSNLFISLNPLLTDLNGLSGLSSLGGGINITSNNQLNSLSGLNNLSSINGFLGISNNAILSSLSGLDNINHSSITQLFIINNPMLSTCAFQNICEYLAVADEGDATISGNLVGSNCQDEVVLDATCVTFLPVEFISFTGKSTKDNIVLNWKTDSERNNHGFDIEHSKEGNNWKEIGYQDGQGTSNRSHDYQFIDHQPNAGVNYYRLRQNDFDGAFTYFKTIAVHWKNNTKIPMLISPNPVGSILSVELPEDIEGSLIQLLDATGQQIGVPMLERNNRFTLDCNRLSPGMYMIVVETDSERSLEKFIKK